MKIKANPARLSLWLSAFGMCFVLGVLGQDSSGQSLGDVARKTREQRSATTHVRAKQVSNEEEDGPDGCGVWRIHLCALTTPCYEFSVVLPKSPKWTRASSEPRPVLIPVAGHEQDPSRAIRVYAAESLAPMSTVDVAKRTFLQAWFARPEYFGQSARLTLDERVSIDGHPATITHFSVSGDAFKYRGLSVVAGWTYGNYGFACAYRDEDSDAATSICDAIVKSAQYHVLEPSKPRVYPEYPDPQGDSPPYDPPEDDDPE